MEKANIKNLKKLIDLFDNQIDKLVYKLYGLTKEEIRIVEWGFVGARGSTPNDIDL